MTLIANVGWNELTARVWDVVVVGAGPAGSLAARQLARYGLAVLLIDKSAFPRWKVCGCCLNGSALSTLESVGLGELTGRLDSVPLHRAVVASAGRQASVQLNQGRALSRRTLDAALVEAAIEAGARFLPETAASRSSSSTEARRLCLRQADREVMVETRVLLAADGLGGRLLANEPGLRVITERDSRIGAGAVTSAMPEYFTAGTVYLTGGARGYLGLVRLEDGRLDLAAALDRRWTRQIDGPGPAAKALLKYAGWPTIPGLLDLPWRGTPTLTRRMGKPAAERVFVIGDAAGYVEPFTGEGIAWALAAAVAVAPIAAEASRRWHPSLARSWIRRHRRLFEPRRRACRAVTRGLRIPSVARFSLALLSHWPSLAGFLVRRFDAPIDPGRGPSP
jgi:flavin-dependent dehydrogenase